jgi:hypothetical protein
MNNSTTGGFWRRAQLHGVSWLCLLLLCTRKCFDVTYILQSVTVFARPNTEIVGSNPTGSVDISMRLFCVCVVPCVGSGLATGWSPSKGSYRLCVGLGSWKRSQGPAEGLNCRSRYTGGSKCSSHPFSLEEPCRRMKRTNHFNARRNFFMTLFISNQNYSDSIS